MKKKEDMDLGVPAEDSGRAATGSASLRSSETEGPSPSHPSRALAPGVPDYTEEELQDMAEIDMQAGYSCAADFLEDRQKSFPVDANGMMRLGDVIIAMEQFAKGNTPKCGVTLCAPGGKKNPFPRFDCDVIDVGHSDRILTVESEDLFAVIQQMVNDAARIASIRFGYDGDGGSKRLAEDILNTAESEFGMTYKP